MISIHSGMLVILGFLLASLLGLLLASAFWARAVRLTTRRLKQAMPVSEPEIKADRDRLRAEYAIKVHKLETRLDQAKIERARKLIEINRRDASISALETGMIGLKTDLEEHQNARRVLEQTVADRLPKVEARLAEAKRLLFNRDREIADLSHGAKRHKLALEEVTSINAQQTAQIERLNSALTARGGRRQPKGETQLEGEVAFRSEMESLRSKTRDQATLIDRLQRRLGQGYLGSPLTMEAVAEKPGVSDGDRARETLSEAEAALGAVRAGRSGAPDAAGTVRTDDKASRALRARAEDQAGEIARLKAALSAFEKPQQSNGILKDSRIALKARLGSAEAQAAQQASTIGRLRAELAAANERLARQAAHFMDEMRRVGGGGPSSAAGRLAERRSLADRVAQVRPSVSAAKPTPASEEDAAKPDRAVAAAVQVEESREKTNGTVSGNGHAEKAEKSGSPEIGAEVTPAVSNVSKPAANAPQRRVRLLDRITGLAKN